MTTAPVLAMLLACQEPTTTVFVAASAASAAEEALKGHDVRTSAAATSVLARQIQAGARADVLISAHPTWTDWAVAELAPTATRPLWQNHLVVIGHEHAALSGDGCVAVGDPEHVPAGMYAKAALEADGRWAAVAPRVVSLPDAPAAVQAVVSGACPVGIAYASDAARAEVIVGERLAGAARYDVLVFTEAGSTVAEILLAPPSARIAREHGLEP